MLVVRYLGFVIEFEYIVNISYILSSFKYLDNLVKYFRRIKEIEYFNLFRWCKNMF